MNDLQYCGFPRATQRKRQVIRTMNSVTQKTWHFTEKGVSGFFPRG